LEGEGDCVWPSRGERGEVMKASTDDDYMDLFCTTAGCFLEERGGAYNRMPALRRKWRLEGYYISFQDGSGYDL